MFYKRFESVSHWKEKPHSAPTGLRRKKFQSSRGGGLQHTFFAKGPSPA